MKPGDRPPPLPARLAPDVERPLSPARAFVVQFREQADGADKGFTGRVEHMLSGRAARFASAEELLAFLEHELSAVPSKRSEEG
jgi:hypothetical protein